MAFHAQGCSVAIDTSLDLGGLRNITLGDLTRGEVDITDADSGYDMMFVPGLRDPGTVTFECLNDPDDEGQQRLRAQYATTDGSTESFVITLPAQAVSGSTVTYSFSGFVNRLAYTFPQATNEAAMVTFGVRISGAVTQAIA